MTPDAAPDAPRPTRRRVPPPHRLPFLTTVLLVLVIAYAIQGPIRSLLSGRHRAVAAFDQALQLIVDEYAEPVEPKEVLPGAIEGMLGILRERFHDKHSQYLPPTDNRRFEEAERGKFAGVGIVIRLIQGKLTIHKVMSDSPAMACGLQAGDIIIAADDHDLTAIKTIREAVQAITGPIGSQVTLTILRGEERLTITAVRRELPSEIVSQKRLAHGIGLVRIAGFPDDVSTMIRDAIAALRTEGPLRALVLDFRSNSGGFLDEAVKTADLFVAKGLIVATKSRRPDEDHAHFAKPGGPAEALPIVCLVNGNTASAAEVVTGALQDHGRARLLGTRTFGKGAISKRYSFGDGSGLQLTTGKYHLPLGRQIEGKGLKPDLEVKPATKAQIDATPAGAELPDPQLDAAIALLARDLGATPTAP